MIQVLGPFNITNQLTNNYNWNNYREPNYDPYTDPWHGMTWNDKYIIVGGVMIIIGVTMVGVSPFCGPLGFGTSFFGSITAIRGFTMMWDQIYRKPWGPRGG